MKCYKIFPVHTSRARLTDSRGGPKHFLLLQDWRRQTEADLHGAGSTPFEVWSVRVLFNRRGGARHSTSRWAKLTATSVLRRLQGIDRTRTIRWPICPFIRPCPSNALLMLIQVRDISVTSIKECGADSQSFADLAWQVLLLTDSLFSHGHSMVISHKVWAIPWNIVCTTSSRENLVFVFPSQISCMKNISV